MNNFKTALMNFFKRKNIEISTKRYLIDALGAMAQGLFASLLIGTILNTLGSNLNISFLNTTITEIAGIKYTVGNIALAMTGPAMAISIGYALFAPPLVLFSLVSVGFLANSLGGAGGAFSVLIISIISTEVGKAISKETKLDILVTPLLTIASGCILSVFISPVIAKSSLAVGQLIIYATKTNPIIMGPLVSLITGLALTLPISSAAICAGLSISGLAGGAALAGCCAQMVGFASMSFFENGFSGLISQGIGTSMIQMPNIIKNPKIWIPPIIASLINGFVSAFVLKFEMNGPSVCAGMGTCGLVGQIGTYSGWIGEIEKGLRTSISNFDIFSLIVISFIIPALVSSLVCFILNKKGLIKKGDLKLS